MGTKHYSKKKVRYITDGSGYFDVSKEKDIDKYLLILKRTIRWLFCKYISQN